MISIKYPIRVFGVVNHVPNQYEMLKLMNTKDIEFSYLLNNVRKWVAGPQLAPPHRPIPEKLKWVAAYEPGKYDVAILHVDQQHVNPDIGKGHLYKQLNQVITDIPKIVINHGTPDYTEMYEEDLVINGGEMENSSGEGVRIPGMKELIGDNFMVVNSYAAVERWGWGYPVMHGLDPEEWWSLPKEPRVTIALSPGGLDHYYNRTLLSHIKARVKERTGLNVEHVSVSYLTKSWDDYRYLLGTSLIYINPTLDSPMPRSRTEAMLSGCCVLTSKYHNADEFIQSGVNGFIVPDNPLSYADTIDKLINELYQDSVAIGERGRETAKKLFNSKDYLEDIWKVIDGVANGKPPKWDGKKRW